MRGEREREILELGEKLLNAKTPAFSLTKSSWIGAAELLDGSSGIDQGQPAAAGPQINAAAEQGLSP